MVSAAPRHVWAVFAVVGLLILTGSAAPGSISAQTPAETTLRPMTFLDMQLMRQAGSATPSPDGRWMLYTVSAPDWQEARRQTDIYLVSMQEGVQSTRQMTFTTEKNETSPAWSRDGRFFLFLSNRDAPSTTSSQNQIYLMRPDGGEARRITNAKDGVSDFVLSEDGKWLVYRAGRDDARQLYRLAVQAIETGAAASLDEADGRSRAEPEQLTTQPAGIAEWALVSGRPRIYFSTPDRVDADEKARREKRFTVNIRNAETPTASLWALDLDPHRPARLTPDGTYSVSGVTVSDDGKWVGFRGNSTNRYQRNITQANLYSDLYVLETATGEIERLTNNPEAGEAGPASRPTADGSPSAGPTT